MTDACDTYGVHSEVGRLRKVLVCAPGLAHRRLTPTNATTCCSTTCMWVEHAQRGPPRLRDRAARARRRGRRAARPARRDGGEPGARAWLLDRKIVPNEVGLGLVDDTRAFLEGSTARARRVPDRRPGHDRPPDELPPGYVALAREPTGAREYLMPPLPNTLYTRDTTCWLYGGVTLNPLYWPARHDETLLMKAIYQFHPAFVGATVWWGDPEDGLGQATFEGGDIMPVGNGAVLMGMSERTSRQAITQVAARCSSRGPPTQVVVAGMPELRAAMHLDTVFTFADRDVVTAYPKIVDGIEHVLPAARRRQPASRSPTRRRPSWTWWRALGLPELRVIETGGDVYASERQQWDSGNNAVAARAGRRVHLRPQHETNDCSKAGVEVIAIVGAELAAGAAAGTA